MKKLGFLVVLFVGALLPGIALACPTYDNEGRALSYTGSQLWNARSVEIVAGGDREVSRCRGLPRGAEGHFMRDPDFTVYVNDISGYELEFRVTSNCDANLLVNTGNANWFYDDDDNGNYDPKIRLTRPSGGRYDVWIGTYDGDYCDAVFTLETF